MIVAGYSFNDAHLNELLFDAAARRERSEFIVFCYSVIPEVLANRASTTPNLQVVSGREAILGGVRGTWKVPEGAPLGLWENGELALRDFGKLAAYLARSAAREPETDLVLRGLVDGAIARRDTNAGGDRDG